MSRPVGSCAHASRHVDGTRAAYVRDACRCASCRRANRVYEAARNKAALLARSTGPEAHTRVPSGPAAEHIAHLRAHGVGMRRISELTGVPRWLITRLTPAAARPARSIDRVQEARILALQASAATISPARVARRRDGAVGLRRRLQALHALGWSTRQLSARSGIATDTLRAVIGGRDVVAMSTDARIRELYDALWDQQPPQRTHPERSGVSRTRNRAAAAGWPSPLAWDDDTIDDPTATPDTGAPAPRRLPQAERLADLEHLLTQGIDREVAARRCGFSSWASAESSRARAGRAAA